MYYVYKNNKKLNKNAVKSLKSCKIDIKTLYTTEK